MQNPGFKEVIFLNGKFLSPQQAKIPLLGPGFLSGWGLFETMRAYHNRIVYFDAHLERIKSSAKLIGLRLPYPRGELKKIIKRAVKKSALTDAYVRLTLCKGLEPAGFSVIVKKYQPYSLRKYQKGIALTVSSFRQNENSLLARVKSTSRLLYELSYAQAEKKGFAGSLILNNRGYICEASNSNVFFIKDKVIFTPALACGCLEGITRRAIFDLAGDYNLGIEEGNFTPRDLSAAEEVFLTNSLAGIMPVASLNRKMIGKGRCGTITGFFIKKYRALL